MIVGKTPSQVIAEALKGPEAATPAPAQTMRSMDQILAAQAVHGNWDIIEFEVNHFISDVIDDAVGLITTTGMAPHEALALWHQVAAGRALLNGFRQRIKLGLSQTQVFKGDEL